MRDIQLPADKRREVADYSPDKHQNEYFGSGCNHVPFNVAARRVFQELQFRRIVRAGAVRQFAVRDAGVCSADDRAYVCIFTCIHIADLCVCARAGDTVAFHNACYSGVYSDIGIGTDEGQQKKDGAVLKRERNVLCTDIGRAED